VIRNESVKLKSNDPEAFVDYMRKTIKKNPKVISMIKNWNPDVILVGFKFEVGKSVSDLAAIALESLKNNSCDFVVCNDKEEMKEENAHVAYLVTEEGGFTKYIGKDSIARGVYDKVKEKE